MRDEYGESVLWYIPECLFRVVAFEVVRVVHPDEPQPFSVALLCERLVDQEINPHFFQLVDYLDTVVIAENGDNAVPGADFG